MPRRGSSGDRNARVCLPTLGLVVGRDESGTARGGTGGQLIGIYASPMECLGLPVWDCRETAGG